MPLRMPDWKYLMYDIREWLGRLLMRRWINSNPRIVIVVTNLSVIILILVIIGMFRGNEIVKYGNSIKEWYYDLNTNQLFVGKAKLAAPIDAPSGPMANGRPAGVRAYVFSYVPEPNDSERFIAYLETTDPNYVNSNKKGQMKWGEGLLIKRVGDRKWVQADSTEGKAILREAFMPNENGENPYYCPPK